MRMQGYCDVYKWTILKRTSPEVKCLHLTSSRRGMLLRARRNEKDLKVKPATSFKYFQYLLTKKLKQSSRQRKYNLTVP